MTTDNSKNPWAAFVKETSDGSMTTEKYLSLYRTALTGKEAPKPVAPKPVEVKPVVVKPEAPKAVEDKRDSGGRWTPSSKKSSTAKK